VLPDEIVIADDGSGDETKKVIDEITAISPVPIIHVWQPDEGFQLSRIRNKAIAQSSGEYIINIDEDIILNKYFIHDHLRLARRGCFIAGKRAFLSSAATKKYIDNTYSLSFFTRSLKKKQNAFRCLWITRLYCRIRRTCSPAEYVTGCNMAFWRNDLLQVNGYNENFHGWGGEDCDIAIRLINAGIHVQFIQCYAVAFHLDHPVRNLSRIHDNDRLFRQALKEKITYIEQGIDKHITA
jgi:glycosyltransferase involved in cell wall biosynthesis